MLRPASQLDEVELEGLLFSDDEDCAPRRAELALAEDNLPLWRQLVDGLHALRLKGYFNQL